MVQKMHYLIVAMGIIPGTCAVLARFYPSTEIICGCIAGISGVLSAQLALMTPAISSGTNAAAVADAAKAATTP